MIIDTRLGPLQIAAAQSTELPIVLDILDEPAARLHNRGIHQWPSPLPLPLREFIAGETANRQVYLARSAVDGQAVAALRLAWSDATALAA